MRRVIGAIAMLAACGAIGLGAMSGAGAATGHDIGTPGDANCKGQTTAYVAQVLHDFGYSGLGNVYPFFGASNVKELKAEIDAYCG